MDHASLQQYLSRFQSLKMLPLGRTMPEEDAIRWLVDELHLAGKAMIASHRKDDIIRFIVLAQILESHGYRVIWFKHKHVVGATRAVGQGIINANKEVVKYDKRTGNAGGN